MIYKSLILTNYLMPECSLVLKSYSLFPYTFCSTIKFNPYLPFKFLIIYMLSIYNKLSAGIQNVTGAYVIIMLVYRRLLTRRLHGKAAV